jgi:hypothetical protein
MSLTESLQVRSFSQAKGRVEKVVFGVQKLAFAVFYNFNVLISQPLTFLEKPHQQAGALRLGVFQLSLKPAATKTRESGT